MDIEREPSPESPDVPPVGEFDPATLHVWAPAPPAPALPKFQHRYRPHLILFFLTLATTSWVRAIEYAWFAGDANPFRLFTLATFVDGLWYSLPLLAILGAHEFGHYFACRWHDVDASLPYFLPAPLPLTGTLGAVIRIREAFPSKCALFDIGVAGPIAGFVMLLPFLYLGVSMSEVVRMTSPSGLSLGEPLLFKAMAWLRFGHLAEGYDIMLHPLGFAAWFGMLATALNLMPFGQLDGGHVTYSLLGRRAAWVSVATLAAAVLLTVHSMSWLSMTLMMLVMAFFLGVRHPRVIDEHTPLDARRRIIALFALIIFLICFTPVPIDTFLRE